MHSWHTGAYRSYQLARLPKDLYDKAHDGMIEKTLMQKVIPWFGGALRASCHPPGLPQWMHRQIDKLFTYLWESTSLELRDMIMVSVSSQTSAYREMRLKYWVTGPPDWMRSPWRWFRARFLHCSEPAEENFFMVLGTPFGLLLFLAKLSSISVEIFFLLFLLIDKRDEYLVVRYILKFKGFQFLTGLFTAIGLCKSYFSCLDQITVAESEGELYSADFCLGSWAEPSTSDYFRYLLELVRVLLIYSCGALLAFGYTRGGTEEIMALEQVRLDVADGHFDGKTKKKSAFKMPKSLSRTASEERCARRSLEDTLRRNFDDDMSRAAIDEAREHFRVQEQRDSLLPYFLLWDAFWVLVILSCGGSFILIRAYSRNHKGMILATFYFMKFIYAMTSFPFLVFNVPIIGQALHKSKPTGYDLSGLLVPKLTSSLIKAKKERERKEAAKKEGFHRALNKGKRLFHLHRLPWFTPREVCSGDERRPCSGKGEHCFKKRRAEFTSTDGESTDAGNYRHV